MTYGCVLLQKKNVAQINMACLIDDEIATNYETKKESIDIVQTPSTACFYCNHSFNTKQWQLPINYTKCIFQMWGNFCSLECARSFLTYDHHIFNRDKCQSLLALYAMKSFGKYKHIEKAPNKFLLQMYGGPLTIEEFRKSNESDRMWVVKIPESSTTHAIYDHYIKSPYDVSSTYNSVSSVNTRKRKDKSTEDTFLKVRRTAQSVHTKKKSLELLTS